MSFGSARRGDAHWFEERQAGQAGLGEQNRFVQWGAGLPDLNNDGWMDVFYVTGNAYPEVEAKLPQSPHRSFRIVFRNAGACASSRSPHRAAPG